jgi:aldose 1-epimerase
LSVQAAELLDPARFEGGLDGRATGLYILRNSRGMVACITNYGAKVEQLLVPGPSGRLVDVVLGYDSLEAAVHGSPSMGAFIGRYAGRIGHAAFELGSTVHRLNANNGVHCLHGGLRGSRMRVFDAVQPSASSVEMTCVFEDGEEGFPGTLVLRLVYSVTDDNALVLDYQATALDKPTVASFTTHAFFNLDGAGSGDVLQQRVQVFADQFFGMSGELVANGQLLEVQGTALDLRNEVPIGRFLSAPVRGDAAPAGPGSQTGSRTGYDDCYLVQPAHTTASGPVRCARATSDRTGIAMEVWSTEPALQFYTAMDPHLPLAGGPGKHGQVYFQQHGFCLEPQGYPNAPNLPNFPSSVHRPGEPRRSRTLYRFGSR